MVLGICEVEAEPLLIKRLSDGRFEEVVLEEERTYRISHSDAKSAILF